jgi:single-stranded DNA-binding protein
VEILNQIILAGNLTDQPSVSDAGGRQFVRARLAQNWFYDTQGKTVEHRQFLPLTFFGESAIVAKTFQKGDNIHVTGQLIRREPRPRTDGQGAAREASTIFENHVIRLRATQAAAHRPAHRHHDSDSEHGSQSQCSPLPWPHRTALLCPACARSAWNVALRRQAPRLSVDASLPANHPGLETARRCTCVLRATDFLAGHRDARTQPRYAACTLKRLLGNQHAHSSKSAHGRARLGRPFLQPRRVQGLRYFIQLPRYH